MTTLAQVRKAVDALNATEREHLQDYLSTITRLDRESAKKRNADDFAERQVLAANGQFATGTVVATKHPRNGKAVFLMLRRVTKTTLYGFVCDPEGRYVDPTQPLRVPVNTCTLAA